MKISEIKVDVVECEEKVSPKSGATYYLVTYYIGLGGKYPEKVTDFSFSPVAKGEHLLSISLISDRNKNLSIEKQFDKLVSK